MKSNFRVGGAILFGLVLVVSAYLFRSDAAPIAQEASAISVAETKLREYIEIKDTDGDGLKDWEESLYGTDMYTPDATTTPSQEETATEEEAYEPPSSLTGKLSISMFTDYLYAKQSLGAIDQNTEQQIAQRSVDTLLRETQDTLYNRTDVTLTTDADFSSIREYGNRVGEIIITRSTDSENEAVILGRALENNDPKELEKLQPIADGYQSMISDMKTVPAPASLIDEHLDLLNVFSFIFSDIKAMQKVFEDPIVAMVRVKRYQDDAAALYLAVDNIRKALEAENIVYTNDEPGQFFFSLRP